MKNHSTEFNRNILFNALVFIGMLSRFLSRETPELPGFQKAYLDPGTGSMIISAVIGIFATVVLGFKTFGYKLKNLFRPKSKQSGRAVDDNQSAKS
ncbi:MAG: hypothetical protein JW913_20090 [Chitinispirillaceae bacterium]|nr:hypothetical protein [Chitinispirillaceae bacterium]